LSITRTLLVGAAVSAAVVVGLPSVAAAADTLTVCSSGCDHTTIAAAVAAAAPGDTVLITENQTVSASIAINKDITITGDDGVTITRAGTSANTFAIGPSGDGATISNLEITSATLVAGPFISINGADDVTISGNTIYGPAQVGPPSSIWVTNRAWTNNNVSGLTVSDNTFHTLRTGGYIDNGSGVISGNVTYNTKGDYLLDEQADFEFTGNTAGDPAQPSEWGIVIFEVNEQPYDIQALAAANPCLTVWDQGTGETVGDAFGTGDCDGDGVTDTDPPADKDECKKGGWATFNNPSFRNQGDCVSYAARS
jgi:hypothetical protein